MRYLALGDSISIDDYTGVAGGGAVSQFAQLIGCSKYVDLTRDGCTTVGVLEGLQGVRIQPEVVTLTAGGNDLLEFAFRAGKIDIHLQPQLAIQAPKTILNNYEAIAEQLARFDCPVIVNTIYDPTDGDDNLAAQLDIPKDWRSVYDKLNAGIKDVAAKHGFLLADLESLFHGHGFSSTQPWLVLEIEPNLAGATAIAKHWFELYSRAC